MNNNKSLREEIADYLIRTYSTRGEFAKVDEICDIFEKRINKNLEQLRNDLKNCTPQEYWMLQGEIRGLKKFIDMMNYNN